MLLKLKILLIMNIEDVKQEEIVADAEELYPEKIKENETSVE